MKTYSIPLRERSAKSDYACPDGEIAGAMNLTFVNGSLAGSGHVSDTSDSELPPPAVEFALRQGVVPGWHIHPDMLPSQIMDAPSVGKDATPTESDWGARALQAVTAFEEDAGRNNLFTQPFFALAAWRLADGSHVCPTAPALMIPNSGAPVMEGSADFTVPTMKMNVVEAACRLQWRVSVPEMSDRLKEQIAGIDVFISEPVTLYDAKGGATGHHRFECTNFTRSIGADGSGGDRQIYTETIVQGWKTEALESGYISYKFNRIKTFSLVAEMSLEDISSGDEADSSPDSDFEDVPMEAGCLRALWAMETYTLPGATDTDETNSETVSDDSWKRFIPEEWSVNPDSSPDDNGSFADNGWGVFVTRPLKLDDPEGRKQLLSVALRGNFDRKQVSMALYSSDNLTDWHRILLADRAAVTGLWATRSRFFRLAVKARLLKSIEAIALVSN